MAKVDTTRILWSVSPDDLASELSAKPLLVLLHGYGSNAADLFGLAPLFADRFVVASVEGIHPMGEGSCWFQLSQDPVTGELVRDANGIRQAVDAVCEWLDEFTVELERSGTHLGAVTLLGFSQGGALSVELLRHEPRRFSRVVLLASFVIGAESTSDAAHDEAVRAANIPFFYGIDPKDPLISAQHIARSQEWLANHTDLESKRYAHLGHSISGEMMDDVVSFLARTA